MKTLTSIIAFLFFTSCYAQKQKLQLNLVKGEVYNQKTLSELTLGQMFNNNPVDIKVTVCGKVAYKVTGILGSIYDLEARYTGLSLKMGLPTGAMEFNSDQVKEDDVVSTILRSFMDKPFYLKITKTGKVLEVTNIQSLFAGMFEKFPQLSDLEKEEIQSQLEQSFGEDAFKKNLEMASYIFPDSQVLPGEKWIIKTQLESGFPADLITTYELKEVNDSYFHLTSISRIETQDKENETETKMNDVSLKYDFSGTMNSEVKLNRKSGWVIESKTNQTIKGGARVKTNAQMPDGMTIPISIVGTVTITEN